MDGVFVGSSPTSDIRVGVGKLVKPPNAVTHNSFATYPASVGSASDADGRAGASRVILPKGTTLVATPRSTVMYDRRAEPEDQSVLIWIERLSLTVGSWFESSRVPRGACSARKGDRHPQLVRQHSFGREPEPEAVITDLTSRYETPPRHFSFAAIVTKRVEPERFRLSVTTTDGVAQR